jgi:hypothetical protein
MRSVRAFLPLAGDPGRLWQAFQGDPSLWLPEAEPQDPGIWAMRVHGSGFSRLVLAEVGAPWTSGATLWRSLSWSPGQDPTAALARLLPSCDGEVGLHRSKRFMTVLFDGRYRPPGGQLGAAIDALALSRIAQGTVEQLVDSIAERLGDAAAAAADRPSSRNNEPRHT